MMRASVLLFFAYIVAACSTLPSPEAVATGNAACRFCRMVISDPRLAAQIVARGEEPLFFDDLGCLAAYLKEHAPPAGAMIFVTDRGTGEWVSATTASYARVPSIATPMGSHLVAHRDQASQVRDLGTRERASLTSDDVFGSIALTAGER